MHWNFHRSWLRHAGRSRDHGGPTHGVGMSFLPGFFFSLFLFYPFRVRPLHQHANWNQAWNWISYVSLPRKQLLVATSPCVGAAGSVVYKLKRFLVLFICYCYCYYDYKNMTTFLPNPLSSIFLSFGKRRQAWPRSSKCHRLTCYSFVRSSFVWKSFRKRSATLQSFPVDTIQADQIANTSFAQCESNNKSNNTHHFSIQSFIEIPSYHPWEPGSSHTVLTSLEITFWATSSNY